jgi:hypothetical protein
MGVDGCIHFSGLPDKSGKTETAVKFITYWLNK